MASVLVTGGTGTLGAHIVRRLRVQGHTVRVLSRREGAGTDVGDLTTGEGVRAAVADAEVVVHAASDATRMGRPDRAQTRNLLTEAAGVRHLLYVSIVGIDRIPFGYYRSKLACERLIAESGVPYTILRATQFHDFVGALLSRVQRWPIAPLPTDFRFQPVAAEEVAVRIAELVDGGPQWRAPDFGGPEVRTLAELTAVWRDHRGGPRRVPRLPIPGRVARAFRDGVNTTPEHADGRQTWAQYVAAGSEPSSRPLG